jgi:fructokinase
MRIGIDLGGTKIEAIALDPAGGELWRQRVPTPAGHYPDTLDAICGLVARAEAELGQTGTVGIGAPGAVSLRTGMVKNSNSTVLIGKPLTRDLSEQLRRPVRIENDANCFALSESVDGAAADGAVVFGAILGTGVGGGVVVDKRLVSGRNRIGGEWGHNPLPWPNDTERPGPRCYCGKFGCVETFLAGAGLSRAYQDLTGTRLSAEHVALAAERGNANARDCLALYRDRLARSLAVVINILDPDTIVLGGGLSNIAAIYDGLADLAANYAFSDGIDTRIVRAMHGDSSGVRGAAWLWPAETTERS